MTEDKYSFDEETQWYLLSLAVQHNEFIHRFRACLNPNFFDDTLLQVCCELILEHYDKYDSPPIELAFKEMLREGGNDPSLVDTVIEVLFKRQLVMSDAILDRVHDFAKQAAFKEFAISSIGHIEQGDWGNVEKLWDRVSEVRSSGQDMGYDYIADFANRIRNVKTKIPVVPTMLSDLDRVLKGGLAAGSLGVILGYTGRYKSTSLVNFAAKALMQNKKVFVATAELSALDWAQRLDIRLSGLTLDQMEQMPEQAVRQMQRVITKYSSQVTIKEWPTGECTPKMIEGVLEHWASRGKKFDLVIADQINNMTVDYRTEAHRLKLKGVAEGLRAIAMKHRVPVWSAHHLHRKAEKVDTATMAAISEAQEINNTADVVITTNQTKEEEQSGVLRFFVDKNRRGQRGDTIWLAVSPAHFRIVDGAP